MADLDRVILALGCSIPGRDKPEDCPCEFRESGGDCTSRVAEAAINLLKKQEAVEPMIKTRHDGKGSWWYICGSCNTAVNPKDKYCRECGRELKWDE